MSQLPRRRRRLRGARVLVAGVVAVVSLGSVGVPSAAAADTDIVFNGHGYGHGRGMSQYGSYGYAVDRGATYQWILDHYYGGTRLAGDAGNGDITVELLSMRNKETVLTGPGLAINGVPLGASAVRIRGVSANTFEITVGSSCTGPWSLWPGPNGSYVGSGLNVSGEVRLCEAGQIRAYRGSMTVIDGGGFQTTVNKLPVDDYLRGVVPREMPASWGSAGGGRGMEALKVQAVAARSYALASQWTSYAKACDTTSCQVYGGAYTQPNGGAVSWLEDGRADTAIAATSGQVRRNSAGAVVRTEFSSSTGGWSAGGVFAAVEDLGDDTSINPYHNWSAPLSRSTIGAKLGLSGVTAVKVTQRNGLGADGGRVIQVLVEYAGGTKTYTGSQLRSALGLRSDWFSTSGTTVAEARSYAQALYVDILGRQGDPGGIDYWTSAISSGTDPMVPAAGFAASAERFRQLVNSAYVLGLHRSPDPGGSNTWMNFLINGLTPNELNAAIYGSAESVNTLGGGDPRRWVEGVYQSLLGRGANEDERRYWATVGAQSGYSSVVMAISTSGEARERRLGEYYRVLLGRSVDTGGRNTYLPALAGRGDIDVVAWLAASAEYRQRAVARFP